MKSIVITGAAGFIGSGIVRYLQGRRLILVDRLDHPEKNRNLADKIYEQLLPIEGLFSYLEGKGSEIEAIIHLGACSDTLETNTDFLYENNTLYTKRLAEYALKHSIRFIYASSAATYGDGSRGFSDDHALLPFLQPLNPYGQSKHNFDLWALKEGILDQIVGLKYFNVFGPNEAHKGRMASMVYKMVPLIQKEGVVRLYKSNDPANFGDGEQCRDFIYVKDAAAMTCSFLNDKRGGIYNIGMGTITTWNQLATAIFDALHLPIRIEYIDMPPDLSKQYQNYTCADMEKFVSGKKTSTLYHIKSAVADYVQSHLLKDQPW
ncbi:MAG: ADP-glyceromanno-heptose 6-epimerase [Verrucomicrobia bacterium]|nr:ADP-glyceromanno-heptose 6-epimerase [Verrucomicrobiota bacterium]